MIQDIEFRFLTSGTNEQLQVRKLYVKKKLPSLNCTSKGWQEWESIPRISIEKLTGFPDVPRPR